MTADQSLQFQHNLANSSLRIIVVAARSAKLQDLLPLMPAVLKAVDDAAPGEIQIVRLG